MNIVYNTFGLTSSNYAEPLLSFAKYSFTLLFVLIFYRTFKWFLTLAFTVAK